jgi:hypothetical protein
MFIAQRLQLTVINSVDPQRSAVSTLLSARSEDLLAWIRCMYVYIYLSTSADYYLLSLRVHLSIYSTVPFVPFNTTTAIQDPTIIIQSA